MNGLDNFGSCLKKFRLVGVSLLYIGQHLLDLPLISGRSTKKYSGGDRFVSFLLAISIGKFTFLFPCFGGSTYIFLFVAFSSQNYKKHTESLPRLVCFMVVDIANVQMDASWKKVLAEEFAKPYFADIKAFLLKEKEAGQIVYPKGSDIFNAFNFTPFDTVKVVILGQDPYHGEGEAHGLCFSVQDGVRQPPSLKNIFKELQDDLGIVSPKSGNLTKRAQQGVFLLNASLTVKKDQPNSHKDIGWHTFTDAVIKTISDQKNGIIFLLRGAFAQNKKEIIDTSRHIILECPHPSPFSVYRGFYGSKHFSQVNEILKHRGEQPINWDLN